MLWALLLLAALTSITAQAACSSWRSPQKAWLNEYFFGNGGDAPPNFLEIYSTSNAFPASWQNWSIDVYTELNTKITYPFNNGTATACTIANKTWLTTNVPSGLRPQNGLVLLKDETGAYVDAFVFDNKSPPRPWPGNAASSWFPGLADSSAGCPALADALTSQAGTSGTTPKQYNMLTLSDYGNKDMARDPDGGSRWDLTSNTGSGTTYTQCVSNNTNFTKTVDNPTPPPGSTVTFTLNLANTGSSALAGVQITDSLPPTLVYLSATPTNPADSVTTGTYQATDPNTGVSGTATSVSWSPASVAPGTTSKLNIKMQVPGNATVGYNYVNTAQTTAGLASNQTDFANITIGSPNTPSFAISVSPATATTCTPAQLGPKVTITAMSAANGGGTVLTDYNGTATLTASTPNPKWYDASGALLPGNTVRFTNGTATLYLTDAVAETLTVSATDAAYAAPGVMQGSSGAITFSSGSTGLMLTDVDMLSPAYGVVAGRPHAIQATVSSCGTQSATAGQYSGTIYYVPDLNHPAGMPGPTINPGTPSCPGSVTPPLTSGGAPITLNFSNGKATFYLCASDIGQYTLSLKLNGIPSGGSSTGTSSKFTVRPFVVTATGFTNGAKNNPAGTAAFAAAGRTFSGTLQAWRWLPSADTERDGNGTPRGNGLPDTGVTAATIVGANPGLTAGFNGIINNAGVVSLAPVLAPPVVTPPDNTTYTLGTLSPASATLGTGAATLPNGFSYSEVGNFRVGGAGGSGAYAAMNYLGAAGLHVPILSDVIGRMTPDHFILTSPVITRRPGCTPDSSFTYMDEKFDVEFTLTARNANGATTQNYRNSYAFLDPATAQWSSLSVAPNGSFGLGAFNNGTDLSARLQWNSATGGGWVKGSNKIIASLRFGRNAGAPDGPFEALMLGVAPRDSDGIGMRAAGLNLNGNRAALGTSKMRFGRLKLFSQTVSGPSVMNMPVQAQFWSGNSWILNSDDSCTTIPVAAVRPSNYRDGKSGSTSAWPVTAGGNVQITGGNGVIQLTKPTSVRAGTVDICVDLGADPAGGVACAATSAGRAYLQGRWAPGTTYANDPVGRATFGIYTPETRRVVHIRELF